MKQTLLTILVILAFMIFSCNTKKTGSVQGKQDISIMYVEDTSKLSIQEKNQITIIKNQEAIIKNQEHLLEHQNTELTNQGSVLNNQGVMLKNHDSMLKNQGKVFSNQGIELNNERIILKAQDSIKDSLTDTSKHRK